MKLPIQKAIYKSLGVKPKIKIPSQVTESIEEVEVVVDDLLALNVDGDFQLFLTQMKNSSNLQKQLQAILVTDTDTAILTSALVNLGIAQGYSFSADDISDLVIEALSNSDKPEVLYTFAEAKGDRVHSIMPLGQPLDLMIPDGAPVAWQANGSRGLGVNGSTLIASSVPATALSQSIKQANAITIEAWITPYDVTLIEEKPARIFTLSQDPSLRNFTLGQTDEGTYVVRLRTSGTNLNGSDVVVSGGKVEPNQLTHLVYTWNATDHTAVLYLNGDEVARNQINGDLSTWDDGFYLAIANELDGDRAWRGEFYLVALYKRALSATDVMQNYTHGLSELA